MEGTAERVLSATSTDIGRDSHYLRYDARRAAAIRGGEHAHRCRVQDRRRVMLRGWHYRPDRGSGSWPTIVMAHGFSAVKEMYLDRFAEVFAAAGLGALVFDNRNFGASEGEPRQEIDPWQRQPKKLVMLKGGHFDAYVADFEAASGAARDWFVEHLAA
jgi:alpha-beta hydrolase superfamily lysophospholipase